MGERSGRFTVGLIFLFGAAGLELAVLSYMGYKFVVVVSSTCSSKTISTLVCPLHAGVLPQRR